MNSSEFDLTILFFLVFVTLAVYVVGLCIVCWRLFSRANKPGWAAAIPLYSTYIVGQIAKRPGLALIEIILLSLFIAAILAPSLIPATVDQPSSYLTALTILAPLIIVDLKLEKYFLSQHTPSKKVSQLDLNLNPYSVIKKINSVKYKRKSNHN